LYFNSADFYANGDKVVVKQLLKGSEMTITKTDRIIATLGRQIVSGKYVPGAGLPSETDLCEEFETSRNIIREVFRTLMAKRLIEMRR